MVPLFTLGTIEGFAPAPALAILTLYIASSSWLQRFAVGNHLIAECHIDIQTLTWPDMKILYI